MSIDEQYLRDHGWSAKGAKFLMARKDHSKLWSFFKRLAKKSGMPIHLARISKPSKVAIPQRLRWAIWERDNFTCLQCGDRQYLSIDHIIPESKGGSINPDNLQTLCRSCNSKKGAS